MENLLFKKCGTCGREWKSMEAFLSDPDVELIGYQANFLELGAGLFLFNHEAPSCGTTLGLEVDLFKSLVDGPVYAARLIPGEDEECPGLCFHRDNLEPCHAKCECAYVRDVIGKVREWEKNE